MELTAVAIFGIIAIIVIMWRPLSIIRRDVPEVMSDALNHGKKIVRINIMEDDVELNSRARKIQEARDSAEWVDMDALWDSMNPKKN